MYTFEFRVSVLRCIGDASVDKRAIGEMRPGFAVGTFEREMWECGGRGMRGYDAVIEVGG